MKHLLFAGILFLFVFGCKSNKMKNTGGQTYRAADQLNGTWELNLIQYPGKSFEELYANKKPRIVFDIVANQFTGNTSCNSFSGTLITEGNKIDFSKPFAMTKMLCPGDGEAVFVEMLQKVNGFAIQDKRTLTFITGDIATMRFEKVGN